MICSNCTKDKEKVFDLFGDGLILVCEDCKNEMIKKYNLKSKELQAVNEEGEN